MTAVSYVLEIGGQAAPREVLASIASLEVEDHADLADMLRLRLSVAVDGGASKWRVLDDDLFTRLANVRVALKVGSGQADPLIDAYVVDVRASLSGEPGRSQVDIVAMDATVLLSLEEKVKAWPDQADSAIASAIFSDYGLDADVEDTRVVRQQDDVTTLQRGTDLRFLRSLAERNGYECFVAVASGGRTEGHFHKPRLDEEPQAILNVNLGSATNVDEFNARHDMLGATTAQATGLEVETGDDQSGDVSSAGQQNLGRSSSVPADRPRRVLVASTGLTKGDELQAYAQALVDRSSFAISAEGRTSGVLLGKALRAKKPVLVRGAGSSFSGTYYVQRVHHVFAGEGHVQHFSLRRNAVGLTRSERFQESRALPNQQAVRV